MAQKLDQEARTALLKAHPEWQLVEGRDALRRSFKFKTFNQAFGFMARIAMQAEKLDHHPEWSNVYNRVEILMTTHDVDGISELDAKMIKFIDAVLG